MIAGTETAWNVRRSWKPRKREAEPGLFELSGGVETAGTVKRNRDCRDVGAVVKSHGIVHTKEYENM